MQGIGEANVLHERCGANFHPGIANDPSCGLPPSIVSQNYFRCAAAVGQGSEIDNLNLNFVLSFLDGRGELELSRNIGSCSSSASFSIYGPPSPKSDGFEMNIGTLPSTQARK